MSGAPFLPRRIGLAHRRLGRLHVFTADAVPGLHVASADLRTAYDLLEPVAGEIVRRMTGLGVAYRIDESFTGFFTRGELQALMRPRIEAPKREGIAQARFLSRRRLIHALHGLGTRELGKRDRRASYWRSPGGTIFSVMNPEQRTQTGELLYVEEYARDLLGRLTAIDRDPPSVSGEPDLTLHLMPL